MTDPLAATAAPPVNLQNAEAWRRVERALSTYDGFLRAALTLLFLHYLLLFFASATAMERVVRALITVTPLLASLLEFRMMRSIAQHGRVPYTATRPSATFLSAGLIGVAAVLGVGVFIFRFVPLPTTFLSDFVRLLLRPVFLFAATHGLMLLSFFVLLPSLRRTASYLESPSAFQRSNVVQSSLLFALFALLALGTVHLRYEVPVMLSLPLAGVVLLVVLVAAAQHAGLVRHVRIALHERIVAVWQDNEKEQAKEQNWGELRKL